MADERKSPIRMECLGATEGEAPDGRIVTISDETIDSLRRMASIVQAMRDTPTLATADPRFWVVQQRRWRDVPEGCGGEAFIWNAGGLSLLTPKDFATDWLENEMEEWDDSESKDEIRLGSSVTMTLSEGGNRDNPYDWEVKALDLCALMHDIEENVAPSGNEVVWRDWEWETVENTMFLTLEECEEHIRLNSYHYDHPRSFCMHAWRAPQVATLWRELKAIDWNALVTALEEHGQQMSS